MEMILFSGLGYGNRCQAKIWVYDRCNRLVSKGCTYNGRYTFKGCLNSFYKIRIDSYLGCIETSFFAQSRNVFIPLNGRRINTVRQLSRFLLTDYYYNNLPIMKGEMYFG